MGKVQDAHLTLHARERHSRHTSWIPSDGNQSGAIGEEAAPDSSLEYEHSSQRRIDCTYCHIDWSIEGQEPRVRLFGHS